VTATMWRASRLVDELAKAAAGRHILLQEVLHKLEAAAKLVRYSSAKLGVVTHMANSHEVTCVVHGGATATMLCRVSPAARQQPRPKRPAASCCDVPSAQLELRPGSTGLQLSSGRAEQLQTERRVQPQAEGFTSTLQTCCRQTSAGGRSQTTPASAGCCGGEAACHVARRQRSSPAQWPVCGREVAAAARQGQSALRGGS